MKRFQILILFFLLLSSCRKIMHQEEISIGKINSYDQLVSAANGVYARLIDVFFYPDKFYPANLKGDDINTGVAVYTFLSSDGKTNKYMLCYSHKPGDGFNSPYLDPDALWNEFYSAIVSANNIIVQYNLSSTIDRKTREILGEMYLIRAYCHFRLTRVYGQIPIINNIDISYMTPKSSFAGLYKFIENDLRIAMELLPNNNSSARVPFETPHRASAKAILAEVYLSWAGYPANDASKYALAAKEAGETIDSAGFFGLGLVSDFAFLWDKPHLHNCESLFSLYCNNPAPDFYPNKYPNLLKCFYYCRFFSKRLTYGIGINTYFYPAEINFYNSFPEGYRKEITFFTIAFYSNSYREISGDSIIYREDTGTFHVDKVNTCCRMAYRKFYNDPYEIAYYKYSTDSLKTNFYYGAPRIYVFRYAQTVLTYAEAMARSGQLNAQAYECVNQIRRRAHQLNLNTPSAFDLPAGLSPGAFADSVVQERAWELCAEPEGRWFDLVRLEKVEELSILRNPLEDYPYKKVFSRSDYFFPIPANEKILNPNL